MSVFMLTTRETAHELNEAYQSGDPKRIETAWENMQAAIGNDVLQKMQKDVQAYQQTGDKQILAQRGFRTLTSKEETWYQRVIDAMKSTAPQQAFAAIIGSDAEDDIMPSTIYEDVFRQLEQDHPLLKLLNVQQTGYLTKWILNNHTAQTAVWGSITDAIAKEITSSLTVVDVKQNKLSCYAILELGMLDLGPVFLDRYVRACMMESMSAALEMAVITGTGIKMPVGMDRDLSDSSYNASTGWAQKTAEVVTSFAPAAYGPLVSKLTKDGNGKVRTFDKVVLICNLTEYLNKIMPATTILTVGGSYAKDLFPFPTDVVVSSFVPDGHAILGLPKEYTLMMGASTRSNVIEYDDSVRFLEDQRVFKIITYADGRAYDNTSFIYLDISGLESAYLPTSPVETA